MLIAINKSLCSSEIHPSDRNIASIEEPHNDAEALHQSPIKLVNFCTMNAFLVTIVIRYSRLNLPEPIKNEQIRFV